MSQLLMSQKIYPSLFYVQDLFHSLRKGPWKRIGFEFPGRAVSYHRVMASTRLRVYDVIRAFCSSNTFQGELFKSWNTYKVVIFQKKFDQEAYVLAKKLKEKGTKIVLDVNVNYFDPSWMQEGDLKQFEDAKKFIDLCDSILVTTDQLKQVLTESFHKTNVHVIEENIPEKFFRVPFVGFSKAETKIFVYNGYAAKAREILLIQDVLRTLAQEYNIEYRFICEKDPRIQIPGVRTKFIKYQEAINERQLSEGHLYLAPRDLGNAYNLSHSFTKIGSPMAVGLPVIASPIPSYTQSPAVLIQDFGNTWYKTIKELLDDQDTYTSLSNQGRTYCRKHFSPAVITRKYQSYFDSLTR